MMFREDDLKAGRIRLKSEVRRLTGKDKRHQGLSGKVQILTAKEIIYE